MAEREAYYREKIAESCGIRPDEVDLMELGLIAGKLDSTASFLLFALMHSGLVRKYFTDEIDEYPSRIPQITQDIEGLFDRDIDVLSYGLFAPSYLEMMQKHRKDIVSPRVLLAGSLTADTSREFSQTVRMVYPQARLAVLDIDASVNGRGTVKEGIPFVQGDIFNAPLPVGAFDEIHSNAIFDMLEGGPKDQETEAMLEQVYSLLKDGGTFYTVERRPDALDLIAHIDKRLALDMHQFWLHKVGIEAGFRSVSFCNTKIFRYRWDAVQFLSGNLPERKPVSSQMASVAFTK